MPSPEHTPPTARRDSSARHRHRTAHPTRSCSTTNIIFQERRETRQRPRVILHLHSPWNGLEKMKGIGSEHRAGCAALPTPGSPGPFGRGSSLSPGAGTCQSLPLRTGACLHLLFLPPPGAAWPPSSPSRQTLVSSLARGVNVRVSSRGVHKVPTCFPMTWDGLTPLPGCHAKRQREGFQAPS